MRVLVLFTGGTIGAAAGQDGVFNTAANGGHLLLTRYQQQNAPMAEPLTLETRDILNTLSENMTIARWNTLLTALRDVAFAEYDGVILTHGTDTLGFTANLLAVLLEGISVPLVLVSSHYILTDPRANGVRNFAAAIDFLREATRRKATGSHDLLAGVYATCCVEEEDPILLRGAELRQCDGVTDRFESGDGHPFGWIRSGQFIAWAAPVPTATANPHTETDTAPILPLLYRCRELLPCVLALFPYPGLDYRTLTLSPSLRAVLHGAYHSGTACADGKDSPYSLLWFARVCAERKLPLLLASPHAAQSAYASADMLRRAGVHPISGCRTFEAAYARTLVAFSLPEAETAARTALLR